MYMKSTRDYTIPYSADGEVDVGGMGDLDALLDSIDNPNAENQENDSTGGTENQQEQNQENTTQQNNQEQNQQDNQQQTQQARQNYAFGQMRQQISTLQSALQDIAKQNNIQYNDTNDLINKLHQNSMNAQAEKSKVPVELLQEINALKTQVQQSQINNNRENMVNGFSTLMKEYGLSKNNVSDFVNELLNAGINPALQQVDIVKQYQTMHQQDVINHMVDVRVQEALNRVNQADAHSSTPNLNNGAGGTNNGSDESDKIDTLAGLDNLLKGIDLTK